MIYKDNGCEWMRAGIAPGLCEL